MREVKLEAAKRKSPRDLMDCHLPGLEIRMIDIGRKRKRRIRFRSGIFRNDILLYQQINQRLRDLALIQQNLRHLIAAGAVLCLDARDHVEQMLSSQQRTEQWI